MSEFQDESGRTATGAHKKFVLGRTRARVHTIEFHKRGLPHLHLLLILEKRIDRNDYDKFVSAEISDSILQPRLYNTVIKHMLHGPCGANVKNPPPCFKDNKCTKGFPKTFSDTTVVPEDGYVQYRRRDMGRTV